MLRYARPIAAGAVLATFASGAAAQDLEKVRFQTDWIPSGEHAMYYGGWEKGIFAEEGLDTRWHRHEVLGRAVRAAVGAWSAPGGLSLYATCEAERSNAVTTIHTGDVDVAELSRRCRERLGVTLGVGIGELAGSGSDFRDLDSGGTSTDGDVDEGPDLSVLYQSD